MTADYDPGNMGQICTATSRILVQDSIYEKFIDAFKAQVKKVSIIGDPFAQDTFQGPQINKTQWEKVMKYIDSGRNEGAKLVVGGKKHGDQGYFIAPTIFMDVEDDMIISREEIFGPVVTIASFKSEEDAVRRANNSKYGLGAAIFTQNVTRAHKIAAKIQAGMVWVGIPLNANIYPHVNVQKINSSNDSHPGVPFG